MPRFPTLQKSCREASRMKRPVSPNMRLTWSRKCWQPPESFFERYSWMTAKSTNFKDLNFAFQSLLQGYG
jgi:hypothetical protein